MADCRFDHITVTARNLDDGVAFVRAALGVEPQIGGKHARMGTHNLLLKLGDSSFLEVIAPDPDAVAPKRPRWFELDKLPAGAPARLSTWVARTDDVRGATARASESLGEVEPISRGDLNWLITIPADGSLPCGGIAPALIEWQADVHPAAGLKNSGCSLMRIEAFHPDPRRMGRLLSSIGFSGDVAVSRVAADALPYLVAYIETPAGERQIGGPGSRVRPDVRPSTGGQ